MSASNPHPPLDLAATAVRALVLYSLMEFQSGHATTLRVTAEGSIFGISDDGRGHPPDKVLEGTNYLAYIYTHFDYPFAGGRGGPVQLQGIGMSLVNALCSALTLTVRKRDRTLTMTFDNGRLVASDTVEAPNEGTGLTVSCRLRPEVPAGGAGTAELEAWLLGLTVVHPTLKLFFNGRELTAPLP